MMPDHADERQVLGERHRVVGHRRQLVVLDEPGGEREHPQALLAHPLVRGVDVRRAPASIGTCEPLSGPPDWLQRASTTSGAALDQLDDVLGPVDA